MLARIASADGHLLSAFEAIAQALTRLLYVYHSILLVNKSTTKKITRLTWMVKTGYLLQFLQPVLAFASGGDFHS
ncbi:hypothetical protein [Nostoc sp.]|uniref:hypothetical protein n=1 Tax=Nostoc sp. TaxID=1180 RepID=UPI002FF07037